MTVGDITIGLGETVGDGVEPLLGMMLTVGELVGETLGFVDVLDFTMGALFG